MGLSLVVNQLRWSFPGTNQPFLTVPRLDVPAGAFLAVTGPSGAGKSTLLYLLAGLEAASPGAILWGDFDGGAVSTAGRDRWRRKNLGLVFQDFQLVPELSAVDNVLLPLTFGQWSISKDDRRRAADTLVQLGVTRTSALASTLSRGEMQRTALARALSGRPPVVLADEPTASLDATNEDAVGDLLVDYARREGATIVVSTHQPRLRDRADLRVRLDHGTVTLEAL
jgi:putative ABC transport system ATP-binding protein